MSNREERLEQELRSAMQADVLPPPSLDERLKARLYCREEAKETGKGWWIGAAALNGALFLLIALLTLIFLPGGLAKILLLSGCAHFICMGVVLMAMGLILSKGRKQNKQLG